MTLPCDVLISAFVLRLNHVENLCLANAGKSRTLETPAVASTTLRISEPGLARMTLFAIGPDEVATIPRTSVRPSIAVVILLRTET